MDSQQTAENGDLTGLAFDPVCKMHETGLGHPEQPGRLDVIISALTEDDLADKLKMIQPHRVTNDQLCSVHAEWYAQRVKSDIRKGLAQLSTGDTPLSSGSL